MTAHELAQKLLEGPDFKVRLKNPETPDHSIVITGVRGIGQYSTCTAETEEEEEDYEEFWQKAVILNVCSEEGCLRS